jgi:hypothetical protein
MMPPHSADYGAAPATDTFEGSEAQEETSREAPKLGWLFRGLPGRRARSLIPTVHQLAEDIQPSLKSDTHLRQLLLEHSQFLEQEDAAGAMASLKEIDGLIARISIDFFRRQNIKKISVEAISVPNSHPVRVILILRAGGYQGRQYLEIPC